MAVAALMFDEAQTMEVKRLLAYDPDTGLFTWNVARPGGLCSAGARAGSIKKGGYRQIMVCGKRVQEHRLAFLFMEGRMPDPMLDVDHVNGQTDDNRWSNLRLVTVAMNMQNQRRARTGKNGNQLGAYWHKRVQRWQAAIMVNGRLIHVGYFDSEEEAHAAYIERKRQLHPGCTI